MSREADGRMSTYRVEFFFIGTRDKLVTDSWEVEEWRYPDLTNIGTGRSDGKQTILKGGTT